MYTPTWNIQNKANGHKIRSKCDCYEYKEKSSTFFLNLEKKKKNALLRLLRVKFVNK